MNYIRESLKRCTIVKMVVGGVEIPRTKFHYSGTHSMTRFVGVESSHRG